VSAPYNPIIRTFNRLRAGLVDSLGLARHEVRPGIPLDALLPATRRRAVWRHLRRQGLPVPELELPPQVSAGAVLVVLKTLAPFVWWLKWPALLAFGVTRRHAVRFPAGLRTVGELALYMTEYRGHKDSGYRWTKNEIEFRVRVVVAEALGLALDEVQPQKKLRELGAE
jgi:hypothetical protein